LRSAVGGQQDAEPAQLGDVRAARGTTDQMPEDPFAVGVVESTVD
jgi:hypothetical protein